MKDRVKPGNGKIHLLKPALGLPPAREEAPEEALKDMVRRLDRLEREFSRQIFDIERRLEGKKSQTAGAPRKFSKEIGDLKTRFDHQIEDILGRLKPAQKTDLSGSFFKKIATRFDAMMKGRFNPLSTSQELLEEKVDAFGRDPAFEQKLKPLFDFFYYRYWRVSTHGLQNVPGNGRALIVSNHSGTLPYDGSMIRLAVTNDHPSGRDVRFLVEDFVYYLPFVGTFMYRIGGVRASPENAQRLLENDHLVAVFPEGVKGIGKNYSERYHLQRFGRGGFIKLALKTRSPIIPVAVIGAEEIHPILWKSSLLAKPLGIPYIPITPTLPLLGPLGLIPFPTKWSIHFGEPIDLTQYGKKTLDDELQIHKLSEMVRQKIQVMITEALKMRRSVLWG